MDKKPVLPNDEVVETQQVNEKYPGSPERHLYSANFTPSPSELEWEHAWDFLTNSDVDINNQITQQLLKRRFLWEKRRANISGESCMASVKSDGHQYFYWKYQDDNEWSKDRIKCLRKGLVDISSENSQPSSQVKLCFCTKSTQI